MYFDVVACLSCHLRMFLLNHITNPGKKPCIWEARRLSPLFLSAVSRLKLFDCCTRSVRSQHIYHPRGLCTIPRLSRNDFPLGDNWLAISTVVFASLPQCPFSFVVPKARWTYGVFFLYAWMKSPHSKARMEWELMAQAGRLFGNMAAHWRIPL